MSMLSGEVAEIRWGYYVAAKLREYSMNRVENGDGWLLGASVVTVDAMRLLQQPLFCVVPGTPWRWPVVSLQYTDQALSASLGPLEGSVSHGTSAARQP